MHGAGALPQDHAGIRPAFRRSYLACACRQLPLILVRAEELPFA
jgi:hypothetical protein